MIALDIRREHHNSIDLLRQYRKGERSNKYIIHDVIISIKQLNEKYLLDLLNDVSSLHSSSYGKYKTFDEIGNTVSNPTATATVLMWLMDNSIDIIDQTGFGEYITARAPIYVWENVLKTEFHEYHSIIEQHKVPYHRVTSFYLPEDIHAHVQAIINLSNLPVPFLSQAGKIQLQPLSTAQNSKNLRAEPDHKHLSRVSIQTPKSQYITPYVLNNMYGLSLASTVGYGSQSISLFTPYLVSDVFAFDKVYNVSYTDSIVKGAGLAGSTSICSNSRTYSVCGQSAFSMEYLSVYTKAVPTTTFYLNVGDVISWILNISYTANPPLVNVYTSFSYEVFFDVELLNIFATEAIKLNARGITLITASGDDGVTG